MAGMESNYCKIVAESLLGERAVDELTFDSLSILTERLNRLKEVDPVFSEITLSSDAKKLTRQKDAVEGKQESPVLANTFQ